MISVRDDPEFFDGLTIWGDSISAQIREGSQTLVVYNRKSGLEIDVNLEDAIRLRDLLNVATARGFL